MSNSKPDGSDVGQYNDGLQRRQQPSFTELRRPGYLLKWMWGFLEGWFLSRNYRQLAIGLPFLVIAVGAPMFVWWLKSAPRDGLVAAYEVAVEESIDNDEPEKTGLYLESLVGLRKLRKQYRHQLVMHHVEQGQPEKAAAHVSSLVGEDGYVPTRIWLLQQAEEMDPVFPLSEEDKDRQLNAVLAREPMNVLANWQMAERLIQKQQYKTAEDHLLQIVDQVPQLGLLLAEVQMELQRDREQILEHLEVADQSFQKALLSNNKDTVSRINRAEVMLKKNDLASAMELIVEGRRLEDNEQLRAAESRLLKMEAERKLSLSNLNAAAAAQDLVQAIQLNPRNSSLLADALLLSRQGVTWKVEQLEPAIDVMLERSDLSETDRQLLLASLSLTGQNQKALDVIDRKVAIDISDRVLQADLLLRDGQKVQAEAFLEQLLAETEAKNDVETCMSHAQVLLLLKRHQDAYDLIESSLERFSEPEPEQNSKWQSLFVQANLGVFRKRFENAQFKSADEVIKLLTDSRQGPVSIFDVVQRMMVVMNARSDFEPAIRSTLVQLARRNRGGWQIYNMLGTYDLQKSEQNPERLPDALKSLELAYQSQKSDPMLMNNLAIALVRNGEDLKRARELAEEAIKRLADPVDALSTRAEISVAEELWEEARADLEIALAARPNSANVRRLLVKVLTALNQPSLAEEHQIVYEQLTAARKSEGTTGQGEPKSD